MTFSPLISGGYGDGDTGELIQLANGNLLAFFVQEVPFEGDTSYFRIFDLNGNPLTDKVEMPDVTAYYLGLPILISTGGGDFLLGWSDQASTDSGEVYIQKFIDDNKTIQFGAIRPRSARRPDRSRSTVTRTGDLSAPASVMYATADETAKAGSDYATVSGTLHFAAGQSSATINVPILNDGVIEPAETFRIVLSNAVGAGLGGLVSAQVTINDDDAKPLFVDFGASGLWSWTANAGFIKLSGADPENLATGPAGDLFVDFGASGLWRWSKSGGFQQLNASNPQAITAGPAGELYVDFGGFGLWRWTAPSGLRKLSGADPQAMVANPTGGLYLDFGGLGRVAVERRRGVHQAQQRRSPDPRRGGGREFVPRLRPVGSVAVDADLGLPEALRRERRGDHLRSGRPVVHRLRGVGFLVVHHDLGLREAERRQPRGVQGGPGRVRVPGLRPLGPVAVEHGERLHEAQLGEPAVHRHRVRLCCFIGGRRCDARPGRWRTARPPGVVTARSPDGPDSLVWQDRLA